MSYQMDFFAAKSYDVVLAAIEAKKVQYPSYVFIRNEDGTSGRLAFMDSDNVLKFVQGEEQKSQVLRVDVLYIFEDVVYSYNGTEFVPSYKDYTAELEALTEKVDTLETKVATLGDTIAELEASFMKFVELE